MALDQGKRTELDLREIAREYLNRHYVGIYNVTRMRDYPDGSRLYGTPLWGPEGPMVSCRVALDGTIHGTPEHARAVALRRIVCKRPKITDTVVTRYGPARILRVWRNGLRLTIRTEVHGREVIERAPEGHWTVHRAV